VEPDINSNLNAALDLLERGFHVIPLGSPEPAPPFMVQRSGNQVNADAAWPKTPRIKWKQYQVDAPSEEEVIKWWTQWPTANIGLLTGRVIVVDADSKEAMEFMESGKITRTPWKVLTGKGCHYYYQRNVELEIKNSVDVNVKLDIRGYGGYVVAPPSIHHNGSIYKWDINPAYGADSVMDLPVLNSDDLQSIRGLNTPSNDNNTVLNVDTSKVKQAATGLPVEAGGRNNAAASLAGKYINEGKSLIEVQALLRAWNATNPAPLNDTELSITINSISQTHVVNTGIIVPLEPEIIKPFSLVWAHDAEPVIDNNDFVEGVVCDLQSSVFFGKSNTGKSFVVLDMLLHVVLGIPWHGHETEQGAGLYIAAEGAAGIVNRISAFKQYHRLNPEGIPLAVLPRAVNFLDTEGHVEQLILTIKEAEKRSEQKVKMVVVDTLARSLFGGDENSGTDMGQLITNMDTIIRECNTHVGLIHHSGKDQSKGARGHSSLRAAIDTEIEITQKAGITSAFATKQREMECVKLGDFSLSPVTLGHNKRGKAVTSCVVTGAVKVDLLTPKESKAMVVIGELIEDNGNKLSCFHALKLDVRERFKATGITNDSNLASEKADFYRLIKGLDSKQKITIEGDYIKLG